jgi:hypothetical protein
MSIGRILSGGINAFLRLNPVTAAPMAAIDMLKSLTGGGSSGVSSFAAGAGGVGAGLAALTSILNPSSILGRGVANTVGQSLPQLFTPNVAGVLQSSSLATTIANTFGGGNVNGTLQTVASTMGTSESQVVANMGPGVRDMYNQLLKDDPKQARAFLIQEMMASLKLMGEILSNVSKTRSEISMTFARNARA